MEQFKPTENIKPPEALGDKEVGSVELKSLKPYEVVVISPEHPYSDQEIGIDGARVAAVISVGEEDMFVLRLDPNVENKRYATPYLLVDAEFMNNPNSNPNSKDKKHFKGIWPNRPLTVGRHHSQERFDHPNTLSREQYMLDVEEEGLVISNLNPTNETKVSGNIILPEEDLTYDGDGRYSPNYTHALVAKRERKEAGFGPTSAETQYGTYLNHAIIGRDSVTLRNGVYFTPGSEALVVDNNTFVTQEAVDGIIKKAEYLGPDAPPQEILELVETQVAKILKYDFDRTDELSQPYSDEASLVGLSKYVEEGIGVCRHQAILAGLTIEEMITRGMLDGVVGVERNMRFGVNEKDVSGHAWAVFKPSGKRSDREDFIIDPANWFVGTRAEALKMGRWKYDVS